MSVPTNGHFKVVFIRERNEVEPVPHSWEENGVLYWPPKHTLVRQLQSKASSLPDKSTWKKYSCTVKENNILLYMHASASADRYCNESSEQCTTSDEWDDQDDLQQRIRKFGIKKKQAESAYDFDAVFSSSPSSSFPRRLPSKAKVGHDPVIKAVPEHSKMKANNTYTSLDVCEHDETLTSRLQAKVRHVPDINAVPEESNIKANNVTHASFLEDFCEHNETLTKTLANETETLNEIISKLEAVSLIITDWKNETKEIFIRLGLRLDRLEELIQKKDFQNITTVDEENLQILPISSIKGLIKFDKDLEDPNYKKIVFGHLHRVVGSTTPWKQACYKLTNTLFTKELLTHFSWTGLSRSNKKHAFNKLIGVLDIFFKVIYKADSSFSYTQRDSFFRDGILKHSLTRLHGPKKISSKTKGLNMPTDVDTSGDNTDSTSDTASGNNNYIEKLGDETPENITEIHHVDVEVIQVLDPYENPYD